MNYEEEISKVQSYAFTVKKLGAEAFESDYNYVLSIYRVQGKVTDYCFERDSKNKLHLHGVIILNKHFHRKKLCIRGYHVLLKEIFNYDGWVEYMMKDDGTTPQLPIESLKDLLSGDTKIAS